MSQTPIEDAVRSKITSSLSPSLIEIYNDSHLHAHHKAMQGSVSRETHFRLVVVSDAFQGKLQPARHRMVYALLREELDAEGGIHALQLKTQTVSERQKAEERERQEQGDQIADVESR
ncbi:MAG: hypothetical protein Q9191_008459 [Dirinaria sp. TL-2023a]